VRKFSVHLLPFPRLQMKIDRNSDIKLLLWPFPIQQITTFELHCYIMMTGQAHTFCNPPWRALG
jgi:hypothetical protein